MRLATEAVERQNLSREILLEPWLTTQLWVQDLECPQMSATFGSEDLPPTTLTEYLRQCPPTQYVSQARSFRAGRRLCRRLQSRRCLSDAAAQFAEFRICGPQFGCLRQSPLCTTEVVAERGTDSQRSLHSRRLWPLSLDCPKIRQCLCCASASLSNTAVERHQQFAELARLDTRSTVPRRNQRRRFDG